MEIKEKELASISSFYKEQLETLEKKVRTVFITFSHYDVSLIVFKSFKILALNEVVHATIDVIDQTECFTL